MLCYWLLRWPGQWPGEGPHASLLLFWTYFRLPERWEGLTARSGATSHASLHELCFGPNLEAASSSSSQLTAESEHNLLRASASESLYSWTFSNSEYRK